MTGWTRLRVAAEAETTAHLLLCQRPRNRVGFVADRLLDVPASSALELADAIAVRLVQIIEAGTELSPRVREHLRDEVLGHRDPFGRAS